MAPMTAAAPSLDLSRLPAPQVIEELDFETILAARLSDFQSLFADYTAILESDPAMKLSQTDAYRELFALARINDAVRGLLIGFATGPDLDQLAAFYGVVRRTLVPSTQSADAVLESDADLRTRTLLAPEAFSSAGPKGAWLFHALAADPDVRDIDAWSPMPGEVAIAVQSRIGDGIPSAKLIECVRAHLSQDHIKPLTDILSVRPITPVPYRVEVRVFMREGPSADLVAAQVEQSLAAAVEARRVPTRDVPLSALIAAASIPPVDRVELIEPTIDLTITNGLVAICDSISVSVELHDG